MFRTYLSAVPFVLCSLLAPEVGAPAGGGGAPAPAAPVVEKPALPKTLAEAISMLGISREETRQATGRATTAEAESTRVNGQFSTLVQMTKANTATIIDLRGKVTAHEGTIAGHVATDTKQKKDIERLEALVVGAGLSLDEVVPPAPAPEAKQTVEDWNAKLAAATDNKAQMQVLKDFQAAVKAGKVQPAAK